MLQTLMFLIILHSQAIKATEMQRVNESELYLEKRYGGERTIKEQVFKETYRNVDK